MDDGGFGRRADGVAAAADRALRMVATLADSARPLTLAERVVGFYRGALLGLIALLERSHPPERSHHAAVRKMRKSMLVADERHPSLGGCRQRASRPHRGG